MSHRWLKYYIFILSIKATQRVNNNYKFVDFTYSLSEWKQILPNESSVTHSVKNILDLDDKFLCTFLRMQMFRTFSNGFIFLWPSKWLL